MIRRITRAMSHVVEHAVVARELSAGLFEAVASVMRVNSELDAIIAAHDAQVRQELPGF